MKYDPQTSYDPSAEVTNPEYLVQPDQSTEDSTIYVASGDLMVGGDYDTNAVSPKFQNASLVDGVNMRRPIDSRFENFLMHNVEGNNNPLMNQPGMKIVDVGMYRYPHRTC